MVHCKLSNCKLICLVNKYFSSYHFQICTECQRSLVLSLIVQRSSFIVQRSSIDAAKILHGFLGLRLNAKFCKVLQSSAKFFL